MGFTPLLRQWQKIQTGGTHAITRVGAAPVKRMIVDGMIGMAAMDGAMMIGGMVPIGGLIGKHGLVTSGVHELQS